LSIVNTLYEFIFDLSLLGVDDIEKNKKSIEDELIELIDHNLLTDSISLLEIFLKERIKIDKGASSITDIFPHSSHRFA